jgi:hypothetical protein
MKEKIKKIGTIVKSFREPLPIGEEWYEKRMEICNSCEMNIRNIPSEKHTLEDKLKKRVRFCPEGDHCTACGCCTHRKASQKIETCGMIEIGLEPKWNALEVEYKLDSDLTVENITPLSGKITTQDSMLVYDLGTVKTDRSNFTIGLRSKGVFEVKTVSIGCKCTVADVRVISENEQHFDITISTKDIRPGMNIERSFTVEYFGKRGHLSKAVVKIKLNKSNEL